MELLLPIGLMIVGLVVLVFGAEFLVKGASSIARKFGVSALVVGLTVVAFGTSTPELTVNMYAALTGSTDIAIGNILGSNIANILLILGICALIAPLAVKSSTVKWELPLALLAMVMLFASAADIFLDGAQADVLSRSDGLALIGFFIIFLYYVFAIARTETAPKEEGEKTEGVQSGVWMSVFFMVGGLAALVLGGKLFVDGAVTLAKIIGLSEAVIGLTVVAVGTSLPELVTSIVAVMRKEVDIAVGNVVGSNIFNVFWILGLTASITPLPSPSTFAVDAFVGVGATAMLMLALYTGKKFTIDRWEGALFLLAYIAYIIYLLT